MPKGKKDPDYDLEHIIYRASDCVDGISDPRNVTDEKKGVNLFGIPFPINRKLFELYLERDQDKFDALVESHRANYDTLKTALVQQTLHDEMVYEALPGKYKKHAEPPANTENKQFYTFVRLTPELRTKGHKNGLKFREYLTTLAYIGQGVVDSRGHFIKGVSGNQLEFKKELIAKKSSGLYERIVHEVSPFSDLIEAKEVAAIKVFNYSNVWNTNMPTYPKPISLWNLSDQAYSNLEDSLGIFVLVQNYWIFNDQIFGKKVNKKSARNIIDENVRIQNAVELTEIESRVILEQHIELLRTSMDDGKVVAFDNWTIRLKAKIRELRKKNKKSAKAIELERHVELIEGERAKSALLTNCIYQELAVHFDFLLVLWGGLQDEKCKLIP